MDEKDWLLLLCVVNFVTGTVVHSLVVIGVGCCGNGTSQSLSMGFLVPVNTIVLFFTATRFFLVSSTLHPSSHSWPRDMSGVLNSPNIYVCLAVSDNADVNGRSPIAVAFIVESSARCTFGPFA